MKKLIIVNNNLEIGGIQKALVNLLYTVKNEYDITLLLFKNVGGLINEIPDTIKVIESNSDFQYLAVSQAKCFRVKDKIKRAIYVIITRTLGFKHAVKILCKKQKKLAEHYDVAISFQQCAKKKSFYGGTAEFVLNCVEADKKICFLHCDYVNSDTVCKHNNNVYGKFNKIACVSDGVRQRFLSVLPQLEEKTVVVRNSNRIEYIRKQAAIQPYIYNNDYINILSVSRLSKEKGIERVLIGLKESNRADIKYYILGDGQLKEYLEKIVSELGEGSQVVFLGQDVNPYRYMAGADYLILPSYHEAAPMVFDEAKILRLPVLTTETTSAYEMIANEGFGIMCENSQQGITKMLSEINKEFSGNENKDFTNKKAHEQFKNLIDG